MLNTFVNVRYNGEIISVFIKRVMPRWVVFEYQGDEIVCPQAWCHE